MIERGTKCKVSERRREIIYRLIKAVSKSNVSEGGREFIYRLVEAFAKSDRGERLREVASLICEVTKRKHGKWIIEVSVGVEVFGESEMEGGLWYGGDRRRNNMLRREDFCGEISLWKSEYKVSLFKL